ncbi:hypothetical protein [Reinekea blandensis]|uniref:Phosphoribosylanthranilate isomerase n=1 Tax=Reinekea blandensis MED297 TaxID=314283 RepID=A4B9P5_9GAMM|nr:hypothetical protein [Reinekea blandensis]EAR11346.1 hypothetical protein MED297_20702 [Reinekea sp. MED297] [Reinekea blandensis MED297]
MTLQQKMYTFLSVAQRLNDRFDSAPILYGSLGMSQAIEQSLDTDDIDILIEHSIYRNHLDRLRAEMASLGFTLIDAKENIFQRDGLDVGIAHDGDLIDFAGIDPKHLTVITQPARYRILSPAQYLAIYRASIKDGYRREQRQKNDAQKIALLESFLSRA